MNSDSESENEDYWTLGDFMEDHYSQFAIMGIFGTVSVFLSSNFPGGTSSVVARTGTFASLVIFGLAAIWIFVHALGIVFNELNTEGRPISTELGFVTLVLCTGALVFSIGVAITNFTEVFTNARRLAVIVFGAIVYLRIFPIERISIAGKGAEEIAFAGILSVLLLYLSLPAGIDRILSQHTDTVFTRIVLTTAGAALLHLPISVGFKGYNKLLHDVDFSSIQERIGSTIRDREFPEWPFSIAIFVALVGFGIYSYSMYDILGVAKINYGYKAILGLHWEVFAVYHLIAISSVVWLKLITDSGDPEGYLFERINPFLLAGGYLSLLGAEIILVYFGQLGYRVIEL